MQLANQDMVNIESQIIKYALKAVWLIFFVLLAFAFAFSLFVSFQSDVYHPMELIISIMIIIVPFILGWRIDKKHPGHRIALLFLVMAYSSAVSMIADSTIYFDAISNTAIPPLIGSIGLTLHHTMWLPGTLFPLFLIPLYFPDGKLLSKHWRIPVIIIVVDIIWVCIAITLHPWPYEFMDIPDTRVLNGIVGTEQFFDASIYFFAFLSVPLFLLVPFVLFLRYRRAEAVERLQMKWPIFTIIFCFAVEFSVLSLPGLSEFDARWDYLLTWSLAMLFPISIGIAILRHNLFDIDIIINRTLVYGILTTLIIIFYISIISFISILLQSQTSVLSSLIATGIIAVIFQPMKERLQKIVNRFLYGQRDEPAILFSRFAEQLETSDKPDNILPNLVQTIVQALKIPYAAILILDDSDNLKTLAEFGKAPEQCEMIALTYNNHVIGQLVASSRSPQEQFTKQERSLLNTIAALTATTVRSVLQAEELNQSRQRIVNAREEERLRIRRDLHDGLGPALAAHMIQIGSARAVVKSNPDESVTILEELEDDVQHSLENIRRLVYNLRPPILDQLGLVAALRDFIQQCNQSTDGDEVGFKLIVPSELPALPAAVEVATYRIVQEAINNVVRHAQAKYSTIKIEWNNALKITIEDDGIGFLSQVTYGVGLNSMRERTEELGGYFEIQSQPKKGTIITVELPVDEVINTI